MKPMIYKPRTGQAEILDSGVYKGYDYLIVSLGSHPCAYIRLPENNKHFGKDAFAIPLQCNGGCTYAKYLSELDLLDAETLEPISKPDFWIGWDYAHADDYVCFTGYSVPNAAKGWLDSPHLKLWTTKEILEEVTVVIDMLCDGW